MAGKKKRSRLRQNDAVLRLDAMMPLIEVEVRRALDMEAALEGANAVVLEHIKGTTLSGAECFNTVSVAATFTLALTVAKLFEQPKARGDGAPSRRLNKSDVASIPLMLRLLKQKQCGTVLVDRARRWTPQLPGMEPVNIVSCEHAIRDAVETYATHRRKKSNQIAITKLKKFRDKVLAHTLFHAAIKSAPKYADLFLLIDVARDVFEHASLAVRGMALDLKQTEEIAAKRAAEFWLPALLAAARG